MSSVRITPDGDFLVPAESERLEYKTAVPSVRETVQILSGFAEGNGGVLIVGISDGGRIVGISDQAAVEAAKRFREVVGGLLFEGEWRISVERLGAGRTIAFAEIRRGDEDEEMITDVLLTTRSRQIRTQERLVESH